MITTNVKTIISSLLGRERETRLDQARYSRATLLTESAEVYDGLHPYSLSVTSSRWDRSADRSLNLLLPEFNTRALFAGIRTAVEVGARLADRLALPLSIYWLSGAASPSETSRLIEALRQDLGITGLSISAKPARELPVTAVHPDDIWVVTHWTTAHSAQVACDIGALSAAQVVYLIQDFEPGFYPWSTEHALSSATYGAGFLHVFNSMPVAKYLKDVTGTDYEDTLIFTPQLDLQRLEDAAAARTKIEGGARVLFYARPGKPRNLYGLGMSALSLAAKRLNDQGTKAFFASAGDTHPRPQSSSPLREMDIHGKLGWDGYFRLLAKTDVLLSLQYSPHPSHPPLDAVVSGSFAVTNELNEARAGQHPRLLAVEPTVQGLADGLVQAVTLSRDMSQVRIYDPSVLDSLGRPLGPVLDRAAAVIRERM